MDRTALDSALDAAGDHRNSGEPERAWKALDQLREPLDAAHA